MPTRKARIVQISDLHVNRKVSVDVTNMLKQIIRKAVPNILVVSGDLANQPVPWQMKKAANLLREIQESCNLPAERTVIIPGNHDFKLWGNVGLRRLTRIPFERYFRRSGDLPSKGTVGLALNALWWSGEEMREPVRTYPFPEFGIVLFAVNSNTLSEMMAAGKVESHDLQELYRADDELAQKPEFAFAHKIAVVHHHPAPIANVGTALADRVQESFMVFYNAGRFIEQLSKRGFSLVLHGHKHVAGFVRVGCDFPEGRTVLPVVAAGSASHPHPDDTRGHNLQIIDIFDDGTAKLEMRFFSADQESKQETCFYDLENLSDVRRRRYSTFRGAHGCSSYEVSKSVKITGDGYTEVEIRFCGARASKTEGLNSIPLSLKTERPTYIRNVEATPSSFANLGETTTKGIYSVTGNIELANAQTPSTGLFGYGYKYLLINAHVISAKEFARHYTGTGVKSEFATITCDEACDLMSVTVEFPPECDVNTLFFEATAEYVEAPLRGVSDERLDRGETAGEHADESRRLRIREEGRTRMLVCPNPVPGMIYKLCWTFPQEALAPTNLPFEAEIEFQRNRLLKMAAGRTEGTRQEWLEARRIIEALARDVAGALGDSGEHLSISFWAFDERRYRLRCVCANVDPEELPNAELFSGEGCGGFAFEKGRNVLHHARVNPVGRFIHPTESDAFAGMLDPEVLASFPWTYGSTTQTAGVVVGAVDIASQKKTSKLLGLFSQTDAVQKKMMQVLQCLADAAGELLFKMKTEEAYGGAVGAGRTGV